MNVFQPRRDVIIGTNLSDQNMPAIIPSIAKKRADRGRRRRRFWKGNLINLSLTLDYYSFFRSCLGSLIGLSENVIPGLDPGIHSSANSCHAWIPAFAGMTSGRNFLIH